MATSERVIELLESIDASLKTLVSQTKARAPKAIASDRDLDGQYGDPLLKFMPRDWTGASFKGRRFSECPAALLEMVAETFDYFAQQAESKDERTDKGKPVADYKRADAARARGWAKRIKEGTHTPAPPPVNGNEAEPEGWNVEGLRW
jgi:hypothetical protein